MNTANALILCVDDNGPSRFVRAQTLRRSGFRVLEAGSGTEALAIAAAENLDLVVCDINLPDMSGLEVARRLKTMSPATTSVQVLHVSQTETSDEAIARGLDTTSDAYLIEPVGRPVLIATVRSLLRLRATEQQLIQALANEAEARRQAEDASRAKDVFLAMLSHELRTPLNTIMGWLWQLRHETSGGPMLERAVDSIDRAAQLQAQIIRDLADVSSIERGKIEIDLAPVDVGAVVRPLVEDLQRRASGRDIKVSLTLEPLFVMADASRLDQIVTNLTNNALQFTPDHGHIEIEVVQEDGDGIIRVTDNGQGIAPEFLPHVFDSFKQDPRSRKQHTGLGLGLAIVRRLVEMHHGKIAVHSDGAGTGTVVTVRMAPVAPHDIPPVADARPSLQGARVLLVEDEPEPLELLTRALREAGALVMETAAAPVALELASAHRFDVVLTDIGLPGMDGVELLSRLRASGYRGPAIAITAFATASERNRVLAAGFDTFLPKPVPPGTVIAAAARLLTNPQTTSPSRR